MYSRGNGYTSRVRRQLEPRRRSQAKNRASLEAAGRKSFRRSHPSGPQRLAAAGRGSWETKNYRPRDGLPGGLISLRKQPTRVVRGTSNSLTKYHSNKIYDVTVFTKMPFSQA